MTLTLTPNFNDYVNRIALILRASTLIFPKSVGGDQDATDLVNQIITREIPMLELPIEGSGPPHIIITASRTPIIQREPVGRSDIDVQGPERLTLEFYLYVISQATDLTLAEKLLYEIIQAVTTELDKHKRLTDENGDNPISITSEWIVVPLLLDIDQREIVCRNIVFRPKVYMDLRTYT